jgi:pyridoxal 5'-phosphate synthase pdxT subunit
MAPKVGVLSLQGDFARHQASLESLGVEVRAVRLPEDLEDLDALVMPGGESSTMLRLIEDFELREPLTRFVRSKPVLGTCAGVILLGKDGQHLPAPPLGVLDVSVDRNAYGRQIDSFSAEVEAPPLGGRFHAVFIRAPRLAKLGTQVEVVARRLPEAGGEPVGVRQGQVVGLCFHPELTSDTRFHRWFLSDVARLDGFTPASGAREKLATATTRASS